jgi:fibro-slime domain-containing protein
MTMRVRKTTIATYAVLAATAVSPLVLLPNTPTFPGAMASTPAPPPVIQVRAIVRDFRGAAEAGGHADFEVFHGARRIGVVQNTLDENGKPVLADPIGRTVDTEFTDSGGRPIMPAMYDAAAGDVAGVLGTPSDAVVVSSAGFAQWYRDVPGVNLSTTATLTLRLDTTTNTYIFDSDTDPTYAALGGFFPIDDELFGDYGSTGHNFHFTTEVISRFNYRRGTGQMFKFTGDDDVWVFIDGKLVIDLGGVHPKLEQFVDLDRLAWLTDGENYSLNIFHAERHTIQSNFRIETTLPLEPVYMPAITAAYD